MKTRRWIKVCAIVAGLGLCAFGWLTIAPRQLGGSKSYVMIDGQSMEPKIHRGDLIVLQSAGRYEVGDVVGYNSKRLGHAVLHRIVRREGSRYVFKGDNNTWLDSEKPAQDELIGKMWMQVPGAGRYVAGLAEPRNAALFAGILTLGIGGYSGVRARRRRPAARRHASLGSAARDDRHAPAPVSSPALRAGMLGVYGFGVAAVVLGLVTILAFARPIQVTVTNGIGWSHNGEFEYSAPSPDGRVYDGDEIQSGEPLFTRLSDGFDVSYQYDLETTADAEAMGTVSMFARVTDVNGWNRTLGLGDGVSFEGPQASATAHVDVEKIGRLINDVERSTGVERDLYSLEIVARVDLTGSVAEQPLEESFASVLGMQIDDLQVQVNPSTSPTGVKDQDPFASSRKGMSSTQSTMPNDLSLLGMSAPVQTARRVGAAGALLAALVAVALGVWVARRGRQDEPARISARYGGAVIPVHAPSLRTGDGIVEVGGMDGLAKIAAAAGRPVLHDERHGVHSYLVEDGGLIYRYQTRVEGDPRPLTSMPPPPPPPGSHGEGNGAAVHTIV